MFKHITSVDCSILSLFIPDYQAHFSIREITQRLGTNYSHTFNRIKFLVKKKVLLLKKEGAVNKISLNMKNIDTIQLLSFVEEEKSKHYKNSTLPQLIKKAILIDPFACIGLFGSRVSGKATKASDWDVFIITQQDTLKNMEKITAAFPYITNLSLHVFSLDEFMESLLAYEETVVRHIIRNKHIIYNPHPFYNIIYKWEMISYAPSQ